MSAYSWLNDIQPNIDNSKEENNQMSRATSIEGATSNGNYFSWAGADIVSALTFGLVPGAATNLDITGNQDQTVLGNIASIPLTFVEGGIFGKGVNVASNITKSLVRKSIVSSVYKDAEPVVRDILINSGKFNTVTGKMLTLDDTHPVASKYLNFSKEATNFSVLNGVGASQESHYVDDNGNIKTTSATTFSKEWWSNFVINSIPTVLFMGGAKTTDYFLKNKIGNNIEQIKKDNFNSVLNLNDDKEYHNFTNNIKTTLGSKYSLEEPNDGHNTHTHTFTIIDNNRNELSDIHLLSDKETKEYTTNIVDSIIKSKDEQSNKIDKVKNILSQASYSFSKLSEEDKNNIALNILKEPTKTIDNLSKEDSKLNIISSSIKHSSNELGTVEFKKLQNDNVDDIAKQNDNFISQIKNIISSDDTIENKSKQLDNILNESNLKIEDSNKDELKDILLSNNIDNEDKINIIKTLSDITKPNKYFLSQKGDFISLGFFNAKNPSNNKILATSIKKIDKNIYNINIENNEQKNEIVKIRNTELSNILNRALKIAEINKDVEKTPQIYSDIIEKAIIGINRDKMDYHIVNDLPIKIEDNQIKLENLDNTALKDVQDDLQTSLDDFINKNLGPNKNQLVKLNSYLTNELSMNKRTTFGSLLKFVDEERNGNVNYSSFDNDNLKKIFGNDFKDKMENFTKEVNKNLSNIDQSLEITLKNIFGIDATNITDKEADKINSLLENQEVLSNIIEQFKDTNPDLNNLFASLLYKDKDGNLLLKNEFKNAIKLATKKVIFSALSTLDSQEIKMGKEGIHYIYLKNSKINPENYYSNIAKKALDIMGITSPVTTRFDKLKQDFGTVINNTLGSNNLLKRLINPVFLEPTAIERKISLSNGIKPVIVIEKSIEKTPEVRTSVTERNGIKNLNTSSGSTKERIVYKINGIEEKEDVVNNILNSLNNTKNMLKKTYVNDFLKLNDLLEPVDNIDNFISNKEKLATVKDINKYLSKKSVALLNRGEKYLAKLMTNTPIKFRNDDIETTLDDILSAKFNLFDKFIINENVNDFKDLYKFFEMNDNLQLKIDIDKFDNIQDIKDFFNETYDNIIEKISEFKREYEIIKDFKKSMIGDESRLKVFMSESGRFMYDGKVSYQSNKWSKHFLDFSKASNTLFKSKEEAKIFIMSAIRTGLDEIDYEPINEELKRKFTLKGKDKIDFTKSDNSNFTDHKNLLNEAISRIDENSLSATQIRYYYSLKKLNKLLINKESLDNLNKAILDSKPIVEIDGSQNVIGTINAILSISDDSTGINGHQTNAIKDIYERFMEISKSAMEKSVYSDILNDIMSNMSRSDVKKHAQAFTYGQSSKETANSLIEYFVRHKLFDDTLFNKKEPIGISRLNMLFNILFGDNRFSKLEDKSIIANMMREASVIVDKFKKLKLIEDTLKKGLNEADAISKVSDALTTIYNGNIEAIKQDLQKIGIDTTIYQDSLQTILNMITKDKDLNNKFIAYIGKINNAISSSISNKDYLETIGYKVDSALSQSMEDIKQKIQNNPELKIFFYKTIINEFKKEITQQKSGSDLFDMKTVSMFYDEINKNITSDEYIKALSKSISEKTNFSNLLDKRLTQTDEYFRKIVQLRNTIENVYRIGESVTLLKLNEMIQDPITLLHNITKEINIDNNTLSIINNKLKELYTLHDKKPTFKEFGEILFQNGISPLRSKHFIEESQIPFMQTPSGRKLLYITEKSVNLDKKTGMQGNGFAIINKPLTYFIQGIESDSLSKASMVSSHKNEIEGLIHRFDAVYGKEVLSVGKNLNRMYSAMFLDKNVFNRIENQTKNLLTVLNNYKDEPTFDAIAEEIAKMKILLNEGKLSQGAEEKINLLKQNYVSFFKDMVSTKYKLDNNNNLGLQNKTRKESILSQVNALAKMKKNNIKSLNSDKIIMNQFTNGLKYFEIETKLGVC